MDIITGVLLVAAGAAVTAAYNRRVNRLLAKEREAADRLRERAEKLRDALTIERRLRLSDQVERERYETGYVAGLRDASLVSDAEQFVTALERGEHATMRIIRRRVNNAA